MKVTVIMPVYNREKELSKSIESVLSQTYKNFELIIIDDGSEDKSKDIIQSFQLIDNRIKYYYQTNQGVSAARNNGLDKSVGKYITFLDSDDTWDKNFLEKMRVSIGKSNVCYSGHYTVKNKKVKKARFKFNTGDILIAYLKNITTPNTNSWLIKKEFLIQNNIRFSEHLNWGEDMLFFLEILVLENNIKTTYEYLTYYHLDTQNNLSEKSLKKIDKDIEWWNFFKNKISNYNINSLKAEKVYSIIDNYRIPGTLLSHIKSFEKELESAEITKLLMNYKPLINEIAVINGIRSLKLLFLKYYLFIKYL